MWNNLVLEEQKKNRLNSTNIANNGMKMTIIEYRNGNDIDIQFEDGVIVYHKQYGSFKEGNIGHPTIKSNNVIKTNKKIRVGQTNIASNGQQITIIKYNNGKDIDVQFEDGYVAQHRRYSEFLSGHICNPNIKVDSRICQNATKYIGMTNTNYQGLKMTIIDYRGTNDIDIRFEHGEIKNTTLFRFNRGEVKSDKYLIGEEQINIQGLKMTLISYKNVNDITVQFEDGIVIEHKQYNSFKKGSIKYPINLKLGETIVVNNMKMTIIKCKTYNDINIQLEDGTIIKHISYKSFKSGDIKYPKHKQMQSHRLNETNRANNGQLMTIIAYRNSMDIDVRFEDNTIVEHKSYNCFKNGQIKNPNYYTNKHLNETITNVNGEKVTIIAYRDYNDIDVRFEDGTIVTHKYYNEFKKGKIIKPTSKYSITIANNRDNALNNIKLSKYGIKMWVCEYRNCNDVDIEFETGYINTHKYYKRFNADKIGHPFPYMVNNINIEKPAYVFNGVGNFYCNCTKCGYYDIMTINEVKKHKCIKKEDN
ncbi:MAG: hypothetical protein VZS44_10825 [Bacilli bacterium]|nr:hypothetical protein [Bacilli bacterium]